MMQHVISMLVFDAIIGNSDRHQENWAVISGITKATKRITQVERLGRLLAQLTPLAPPMRWFWRMKIVKDAVGWIESIYDAEKQTLRPEIQDARLYEGTNKRFAPLYDNGSSLGRELEEEAVLRLLNNPPELDRYLTRGKSEIHWNERKLSHFELLSELLKTRHRELVLQVIQKVRVHFNKDKIRELVESVDDELPASHNVYSLPGNRKKLITEMISLRCQKLFGLLQ